MKITFIVLLAAVITGCATNKGSSSHFPPVVREMKQDCMMLEHILDMSKSSTYVEEGFVFIFLPKGHALHPPSRLRMAFDESFKPGEYLAKSSVFAPPKRSFWGFFDREGRPVFLLTQYIGNAFGVVGLRHVWGQVYQATSKTDWNGTFVSPVLSRELKRLQESQRLKLEDDR